MSRFVLTLGVLVLVVFGLLIYHDISTDDCGTDVFGTLLSPDGQHKAVTVGVDCGAATGFNTQLSILPATASFARDVYPPALVMDDRWTLDMRWVDDTRLLVTIPKTVRIYKQEDRVGEVSISYD